MDLRLFHSAENSNHDYRRFDRINSWTRRQPCRLLEWTGWYTTTVPLRLLGHYRLFHIYKKSHRGYRQDIPPIQGYILQCQVSNGIKYHFAAFMSRFAAMWGYPERTVEIAAINRRLIYKRPDILHQFLTDADTDFEKAFNRALQQIQDPEFLKPAATAATQHSNVFVQLKYQHNTTNDNSHNELNIHPIVREEVTVKEVIHHIKETPAKETFGKEKGVFSKKQVLILFDLLAQVAKIERIDLNRSNKLDAIAQFFQALTGKGKETWLAALKDYRNKDLYECHTDGERKQLVTVLENVSNLCRNAGLRSIADLADKKIMELEAKKFPRIP